MKAYLCEDNHQEMHMRELKERILLEGRNLGNGILKVDGFINHQVDPVLMDACGRELARRFKDIGATKVLTAEISGIAPAVSTAFHLKLPVVYAAQAQTHHHARPGLSYPQPIAHQRAHGRTDHLTRIPG